MPTEPYDDPFEERLPAALGAVADEFPLPAPDLVQRATARGMRQRRVRIARSGAAAVALAVVAVGGVALGTSALDGGRHGAPQAAGPASGPGTGPASGTATTTGATTATKTAAAPTTATSGVAGSPVAPETVGSRHTPAGKPTVSDQDMVDILKSLLPPGGKVSGATGTGSDSSSDGTLTAQLTYRLGASRSGIDVSLSRLTPGIPASEQGNGGCVPIEIHPYDVCKTVTLPDGSSLSTTKSFTYPNSDTGQRHWTAVLTTEAGAQLFAEEFGGGGEKATTSPVKPVLTLSQLSAIVTSHAWNAAVATIPVPPSDPGGGSGTPDEGVPNGAQMTAALTALLPPGGTLTDWNASTGYVQVVYNDGHGKNMVAVNAQTDMGSALAGHMGCGEEAGYCKATTLADGTQVKLTKQASEKGGSAVVWLADTLHPDGRRVVVREANSYSEAGPVTRPKPALSLERLRTIALSPLWVPQS